MSDGWSFEQCQALPRILASCRSGLAPLPLSARPPLGSWVSTQEPSKRHWHFAALHDVSSAGHTIERAHHFQQLSLETAYRYYSKLVAFAGVDVAVESEPGLWRLCSMKLLVVVAVVAVDPKTGRVCRVVGFL